MNIVTATFSSGCRQVAADEKLWQWDQGQILHIVGLDLPDVYQVEFSNQPIRGTAAPMIGGVDGVEIPDVYLTTGKPVYAFVVLHAGEDDRETEYKITIPVNARPQPTNEQPTPEQQGVIDQLIAALNAGVEKAEDAADEAEGAADDAAAQAQAAAQSASSSASYAGDAAAQAGLAAAAKAGAEAAQAAAELAQGSAEVFATAAGVAKTAAETAQGKAEDAQTAAETAQAAAESAKAVALAAKAAAETAQGKAEDAQEAAEQAAQDAHVEYEQLAGQVTAQSQTIAQHGQAIAQNTADIADLDTELTQQKSAIDDLTALTNRKAGMLVDTASGAVASFVPDSTIDNLLGVTVDIEPVRDLHGYDHPWPAGAGKNKFNGEFLQGYWAYANGTWGDSNYWIATEKIPCKPSTSYTVSADAKLTRWQGFVWYDANGNYISTDNLQSNENIGLTKTSPNNAYYLAFNIAGYPSTTSVIAASDVTHFQLEEGSSPTTYAPYENICPISGWTGAEIKHSGADTSDPTIYTITLGQTVYGGTLDVTNGTLTVDRAKRVISAFAGAWGATNYGGYGVYIDSTPRSGNWSISLCNQFFKSFDNYMNMPVGSFLGGSGAPATWSFILPETVTTLTEANAWLSNLSEPLEIIYALTTPIVIQLDPVTISTIAGQTNNVWSDAGDVSVEFAADLKHYIDSKIAAAVAALS